MGDIFLTHNEEGRTCIKRLIFLNILLYIAMTIIFMANIIDLTYLILLIGLIAAVSVIYVLNFIYKNPPREHPAELEFIPEED